ncbi:hypothetical protein [Hydrogenimonas thermophila]|uniref:Uncharacterized protein n=1 Tax=Hydrogenimonas thermophila TaxID=223786 RepID=A0A1I5PUP6_9BACT|nr:hypothetical protein [Hydrogenimonas thermophila]WOE68792.1 hypothetical protein RZR91_06650 [Hydrogenimonas thermophila]WOE71302.1 hypothetical protein RZR97_06630 [Hydrogenimonas thermophila]SFP37818.1 hypothetical protein SAMN05216234_11710 [Hydrogenimonas thermophila]
MVGGSYKNIVLVSIILGGFVLFMIITTAWVINDVSKGRSCYRTCDVPQKGAKELKKFQTNENKPSQTDK